MSRHCTDEELVGLVVGDLGGRRARQAATHAEACAACAAALRSTRALWSSAGEVPVEGAPDALRHRVGAAVGGRTTERRPWRLVLGATGATVGAACVVTWMGLAPSRQTIALADVQKAMGRVRTLRYLVHCQYPPSTRGKAGDSFTQEVWIRAKPPARIIRDVAEQGRPLAGGKVELVDDRGYRAYFKDWHDFLVNRYFLGNRSARQCIDADLKMEGFVVSHGRPQPDRRPEYAVKATPWQSVHVKVDGHDRMQFTQTADCDQLLPADGRTPQHRARYTIRTTALVDPTTMRFERCETRHTDYGKTGSLITVTYGYRYDETPPPGTFDLEPPPGSRIITIGANGQPSMSYMPRQSKPRP